MNLFVKENILRDQLLGIYRNHKTIIVGVDFDNTIKDLDSGEEIHQVSSLIKECNKLGLIVCLYTCREAESLSSAINYCKNIGITLNYINSSPLITHSRKPLFNILLDDKAGLKETTGILREVINELNFEKK